MAWPTDPRLPDHLSTGPLAWYAQSRAHFMGNNQVRLLRGGCELFPALTAAIDRARHEVWFATYIFHDDDASLGVRESLERAGGLGPQPHLGQVPRARRSPGGHGRLASLIDIGHGLLVIVGSVILLYMTFAVGKYEFGEKKGYTLEATFDSVAGIDVQASVRMAGVKIGSVEKVELEDSRAKVTLRIDKGVQIKRGSEAMIKTLGLLGEKYVEFMPASLERPRQQKPGEAPYYQNGDKVEATVSPSDVDKLINQLSAISDDVKQITASLRQVLGTEKGTKSMEDILSDLRQTRVVMLAGKLLDADALRAAAGFSGRPK